MVKFLARDAHPELTDLFEALINGVMAIQLRPIGVARTPYSDWAPNQPPERDAQPGAFRIELDPEHSEGLRDLERFSHLIVVSYLDRSDDEFDYRVQPPWAKGREVGLFASRSPRRPNAIGISVVKLLRIEEETIHTSPLDLLDGTPVIDLKPYIRALDSRPEANDGWIEDLNDHEHLLQHLRAVPHDHGHGHGHGHDHGDRSCHEHTHRHEGGLEHRHEHCHEAGHDHDHHHDHDESS
jgi:tRNA (adenine37-N6)-methyltransferase